MRPFGFDEVDGHEHVSLFCDDDTGLQAIIAIHSTAPFGLSGGGCRMVPYPTTEAALRDALRLSRAMSFKLALTEMPAGGAKCVVIGDPTRDKTPELLRSLGEAVERLGGRYIIAEDVGTTPEDMRVIGEVTRYVTGKRQDTGPTTAHGVFVGLKLGVAEQLGRSDLEGVSVAVQGLGAVGRRLVDELVEAGAKGTGRDIHDEPVARGGAAPPTITTGGPDDILFQPVDVIAPCAMGQIFDDETVPRLRCRVIAGAANNQLVAPRHADLLKARDILYLPDFVINAGGVIGAAFESFDGGEVDLPAALRETEKVGEILNVALRRARQEGISVEAAAVAFAKEKVAERRRQRRGG